MDKYENIGLITRTDLIWWQEKISTLDWAFAVTYAESAPHEYVSNRTEGMSKADFVRAARVIHTFGEPQKFYQTTRIYLVHQGWRYWTMDREHVDVALINRGRAHHVYGVQNMPCTAAEAPAEYDGIASYWDAHLSMSEEEREGFTRITHEATGRRRKFRTLDLGAGTGVALDLELTEAVRLTAVDPSQAMLNELVRKHPLVARVEPLPFSHVRARQSLAGTRFDLVLALGGSGSYLTAEDWEALPQYATGRYVLSFYAEGQYPFTGDLDARVLEAGRERARSFATQHGGRLGRIGRFDVVAVSP